jgi:predicted N-acetyltransferase YhbS
MSAAARETGRISLRQAHAGDAIALRSLLKLALAESGQSQFSRPDDAKALDYVQEVLAAGFVVVALLDGAIVGSIALRPLQERWSQDHFLNEEWFNVLSRYRDTGCGALLLAEAEALIDEAQMPGYFVTETSGETLLLARTGFVRTGAQFIRRPRIGDEERDGVQEDNADADDEADRSSG